MSSYGVGVFLFFTTDIFRNKRWSFFKYLRETKNAFEVIDLEDYEKYNEKKSTTSYIRNAQMTIQSSNNVADSSILDRIKFSLNSKTNPETEKSVVNINITSNSNTVEKITAIRNQTLYGVNIGGISGQYYCIRNINLNSLFENLKIGNDNTFTGNVLSDLNLDIAKYVPNSLNFVKMSAILNQTDSQKAKIEEYYNLIANSAPSTSFTKSSRERLELEGISYKVNKFTFEVSGASSSNLQIALLNKLSNDSIMIDYLTSLCKMLNIGIIDYTDVNSFNDFIGKKIQEIQSDMSNGKTIKIVVYAHKQKNLMTSFTYGDKTLDIGQVEREGKKMAIFRSNNSKIIFTNDGTSNVNIKISTKDAYDIARSIDITYKRNGTIEDNNIANVATIILKEGIKEIEFAYSDIVEFSNEGLNVDVNEGAEKVILNDYDPNNVNAFVDSLKNSINNLYIRKGTELGINLDTIF